MGLLTVIKKVKAKEKEIRLLMVGLDNAGKTTIVKKLCGEDVSKTSPTLGFEIKTLAHNGYKLNIWDVGGQTTLRSYWRNYYEQTEGLIWVIDSTDVRRLEDCKKELHNLLVEERLAGATLLIFANKQDISGAQSSEDLLKALDLEKMGQRHWRIVSCSGITGEGVAKGLDWVVKDIAARIYMFDSA